MKGLELARAYYETYGAPMLRQEFAPYLDRIAVGLCGHGSECFGFDDEVSRDHDFEPGFCLWLTAEDEREFGFKLFRAYSKLPKEFMGVKVEKKSMFGADSRGVHTIPDFYRRYTGSDGAPTSNAQWLAIPSFYLAEATNGEVFCDPLGEFSRIRQQILSGMPEDVRRKKLASALFYAAQYGQYNYARCMAHGERTAAACALAEFAKAVCEAVFLLNRAHMPYYKWMYRAMRGLPRHAEIANELELLLAAPYDEKENTARIERIAEALERTLVEDGLSADAGDYLEGYAYSVKNHIADPNLRNSDVMI